jgi:hypothetical protein
MARTPKPRDNFLGDVMRLRTLHDAIFHDKRRSEVWRSEMTDRIRSLITDLMDAPKPGLNEG